MMQNPAPDPRSLDRRRLAVVALFALAMAWVESAVVLYIRTTLNRIEPYQPEPMPMLAGFAMAEVIREAATMVMLASVGWLAGRNFRTRFGYFVVAFGVWDIGYYLFLKPLTGWPNSLLDWDLLFLIPLPWWGPVLAPVMIAALMILFGTLVTQCDHPGRTPWPRWPAGLAFGLGVTLALCVFMADALALPTKSEDALRHLLPTHFRWRFFLVAWLLLAAPVIGVALEIWNRPARLAPAPEVSEESA